MRIYTKPELKLSLFSANDIITTSEGGVQASYTSDNKVASVSMGDTTYTLDWSEFKMEE